MWGSLASTAWPTRDPTGIFAPMRDPELYKRVIDELVHACLDGQGAIGPDRCRAGLWNANATEEVAAADPAWREQFQINEMLARMTEADREVIAGMLAHAFESGVHTTLVSLYENEVESFDDGFEGDPFHDFVGRLDGWQWPDDPQTGPR